MDAQRFNEILDHLTTTLAQEAQTNGFSSAKAFEERVRTLAGAAAREFGIHVDTQPPNQSFPDIAVGRFGIEVKFTTNDTWLSIANSVLETNRVASVDEVFVVFGKMGGVPSVRWGRYEDCVVHVRTSHVPRFEVEVPPSGNSVSLFQLMGIPYDSFRHLSMEQKMVHIRDYARGRLKPGERLWWLETSPDSQHSLPLQARLYTKLSTEEKATLRAEAALLCPRIVASGRSRDKYDDVVLYLLTYHGVLCHQARDMFSAGSVANPNNDDAGGIYIERALKLLEPQMLKAAHELDDELFSEYWGELVPRSRRLRRWLELADSHAHGWKPSESLFLNARNKVGT